MALDLSGLTTAFLDQVNGGNFFEAVAEGTVAGQAQKYAVTSKGTQQLNVNDADLAFTIDPTGSDAFVGINTSNLDFKKRDLTVTGVAAQGYATVADLYGTYAGGQVGGAADDSVVSGFAQNMIDKASYRFAQNFYNGFSTGAGSGTNGLLDNISSATIALSGGATVTAANIIGKVEEFISDYLAVSGHDALENRELDIIMKMSDYRKLRSAYRAANFFNTDLTSERGLAVSTWIDDSRITIYGDPAYAGEMLMAPLSTVYVGDPGINEDMQPQIWYSEDRNQIGYRVNLFGGVQILQESHGRLATHSA